MTHLNFYKKELLQTLDQIRHNVINNKNYGNNPLIVANQIFELLQNSPVDYKILNQKIRAFHGFYGWKAHTRSSIYVEGLCAGAIFRTESYIDILPEKRTGHKIIPHGLERVHIEHSVPISDISKGLKFAKLKSPRDVFQFILDNSVCAAFDGREEKSGVKSGFSKKMNETIHENHRNEIFPFKRYKEDIRIYDLLSGELVSHDSSLEYLTRHYKDYEIFDWNFLVENSKNI